jgi:hypothetical protein
MSRVIPSVILPKGENPVGIVSCLSRIGGVGRERVGQELSMACLVTPGAGRSAVWCGSVRRIPLQVKAQKSDKLFVGSIGLGSRGALTWLHFHQKEAVKGRAIPSNQRRQKTRRCNGQVPSPFIHSYRSTRAPAKTSGRSGIPTSRNAGEGEWSCAWGSGC